MKLRLHIGTEKTGSTSLQAFLSRNDRALLGRKIFYSKCLDRPNNRKIAVYARESSLRDDGFVLYGIDSVPAHENFRANLKKELEAEVSAARSRGATTFVISNEHLHSRLTTPEMVQRVYDLVAPLFDEISVVCFLRPQIEMCVSFASTVARGGARIEESFFEIGPGHPYYNLEILLKRWADVFGHAAIVPVSYKRSRDVVAAFQDLLGTNIDWRSDRKSSMNEAVDIRSMAIFNSMGMKRMLDPKTPNHNNNFFINDLPVVNKLALPREKAMQVQRKFEGSNAELASAWPGITVNDLTPNWENWPAEGNLDLLHSADEFGPYFRYVVERFNAELWLERARTALARSERAEARERNDNAVKFCDEAIRNCENAMQVESVRDYANHMRVELIARRARLTVVGVFAPKKT